MSTKVLLLCLVFVGFLPYLVRVTVEPELRLVAVDYTEDFKPDCVLEAVCRFSWKVSLGSCTHGGS